MSPRLVTAWRLIWLATLLLAPLANADPGDNIPYSGKPVTKLARFDSEMRKFMAAKGIGAATFTLMRQGKIIFHHAYGWKDRGRTDRLHHTAIMRIASCTKPFTAAAIRALIKSGQLNLTDRVFALNGPGSGILTINAFNSPDARLQNITIRDLLEHRGGWDREVDGVEDLTYQERTIADALGVPCPPTREQTARWIMGQPLQNAPGRNYPPGVTSGPYPRWYSNEGYFFLGLVIEEVTGLDYHAYLQQNVTARPGGYPARLIMGRSYKINQSRDEPYYNEPEREDNVFYPDVSPNIEKVSAPYGSFNLEARTSQGRIVTDGIVMVRHAQRYIVGVGDRIGEALPTNGFTSGHSGSLAGTSSYLQQRSDKINYAIIFNKRQTDGGEDNYAKEFRDVIEGVLNDPTAITDWPTLDVTASRPFTVTELPTAIGETSASLHGTVHTYNVDTEVWFEYGTSADTLTHRTATQTVAGVDELFSPFSVVLPDLLPGQKVVYRAHVKNVLGEHYSGPKTFTTRRPTPVVIPTVFGYTGGPVDTTPAGTTLAAVDTPLVAGANIAFRGTLRLPQGQRVQAIIAGPAEQVIVRAGDIAIAPDVTFASFGEPLIREEGFAFSAKLKRGRDLLDSLWRYHPDGGLRLLLLEGDAAPDDDTAVINSVVSYSMREGEVVALVKYKVGRRVTAKNALALLRLPGGEVGPQLLLRQGQTLPEFDGDNPRVATFSVFTPIANAPGQGRSHVNGAVGVRVKLYDERLVNFLITSNGTLYEMFRAPTDAKTMALPSMGSFSLAAFRVIYDAEAANDEAVALYFDQSTTDIIAREGEEQVVNSDGSFLGTFGDVITNDVGKVAFLGTLNYLGAMRQSNPARARPLSSARALCVLKEGSLFDIARVGKPVPDLPDIIYKDFTRFALPDGQNSGPLWVSTLAGVPGVRIDETNNKALHAQCSDGVSRLLLRTGDSLSVGGTTRFVKSFEALGGGTFPIGGRRTVGDGSTVAVRVVFTDGSAAAVKFAYP